MDAVYPYKRTSGAELKLSIALLERFYPDLGGVFIIGDKPPESVSKRVTHIPHTSSFNKFDDQFAKLRIMANYPGLSDNFILMNDDFYLLAEYKPRVYRDVDYPTLRDRAVKAAGYDLYQKSLLLTSNYLLSEGMSDYNFEVHVPMVMNKMNFAAMSSNFDPEPGLQLRSLYSNWYSMDVIGSEVIKDVKNIPTSEADKFISTSDSQFTKYRPFLEKRLG